MYWYLGDDEAADGREGGDAQSPRRRSPGTLPRRQAQTPTESPDSKRGDSVEPPKSDPGS